MPFLTVHDSAGTCTQPSVLLPSNSGFIPGGSGTFGAGIDASTARGGAGEVAGAFAPGAAAGAGAGFCGIAENAIAATRSRGHLMGVCSDGLRAGRDSICC